MLLTATSSAEAVIEYAGRNCYGSESKDAKIIKEWIEKGHESVIEHASATFVVSNISRITSHQLVRHRIASYSQRSQRYGEQVTKGFVVPPSIRGNEMALNILRRAVKNSYKAYEDLISAGIPQEDARYALHESALTRIVVTMNFRTLRNFFKLRMDSHAQWEIRNLAEKMFELMVLRSPHCFGDFIKRRKR